MIRIQYLILILTLTSCQSVWSFESGFGAGSALTTNTLTAPQRTPLSIMTLGFIGVQCATVYANRNDEEWRDDGHQFKDGFTQAPVLDDDVWYYNYALHPWVGSEYFLVARNRGRTFWQSMTYSAALSTFYEYLPENTIQQPSLNDLLVTPIAGALLGEWRFSLKEKIRADPSSVPGARYWIALLDPLDISIGGYPDGQMRLYFNWKQDF
jgi:hypothetical protein